MHAASRRVVRVDRPHVQRAVERSVVRVHIPAMRYVAGQDLSRVPAHATRLFDSARSEQGMPLDPRVRGRVEDASGADLRDVRVHSGPASSAAAQFLDARAFTAGTDIYLGAHTAHDRERLLTHEAVHAVQQGMRPTPVVGGMPVSSPHDASEGEAHDFAFGARVEPHVQRDLITNHKVQNGRWDLELIRASDPNGKHGLQGTVQFTPFENARDSTRIRLTQAVRVQTLPKKTDYKHLPDDEDLNRMRTRKARGVTAGFFIDHDPDDVAPRQNATDLPVVPYYGRYAPNRRRSQDGSKDGNTIEHASLFDFPGASFNSRFTFETVATDSDTGYHYSAVKWGFDVIDAAKGVVGREHSSALDAPTKTFHAALKTFNEFYRNPGTKRAPK